jgi:bifunctional oligoribonuclease and PAP phosphatase NrnA
MKKIGLRNVIAEIKKHKDFLLTTHTNPEGDALGSELAFFNLLKKLDKRVTVVNQDPLPKEYSFLPLVGHIKRYSNLGKYLFDCMVVLDCSDLNRTGNVRRVNLSNKPVINIDHHISNDGFGSTRWVEPHSSSTSEMVYLLYKKMDIPLDKNSALLLYTGIMTDTGSFRYSNTSALTHEAISDLMRFNIDVRNVYKRVYEDITFSDSKLLINILSNVRLSGKGRIAWVEVPKKIFKGKKTIFDLSEHILSFMRAIKGVEVAALFKENFGERREIRFNLRSNGRVDVNKIAAYFGGGGHKSASGCTLTGRLRDIRKRVLFKINTRLK